MEEQAIDLPPLPQSEWHPWGAPVWEEQSMRAYARQVAREVAREAVLLERERCAQVADSFILDSAANWNEVGQIATAKQIASAIRSGLPSSLAIRSGS